MRDGNWVTSRQPKDIPAFNQAMIELFSQPPASPQNTNYANNATGFVAQ